MRDFDADERTADIIQAININGARPLPVPDGHEPWTARDELAKAAMQEMIHSELRQLAECHRWFSIEQDEADSEPCCPIYDEKVFGDDPTYDDFGRVIAKAAYQMADFMLAARKENP